MPTISDELHRLLQTFLTDPPSAGFVDRPTSTRAKGRVGYTGHIGSTQNGPGCRTVIRASQYQPASTASDSSPRSAARSLNPKLQPSRDHARGLVDRRRLSESEPPPTHKRRATTTAISISTAPRCAALRAHSRRQTFPRRVATAGARSRLRTATASSATPTASTPSRHHLRVQPAAHRRSLGRFLTRQLQVSGAGPISARHPGRVVDLRRYGPLTIVTAAQVDRQRGGPAGGLGRPRARLQCGRPRVPSAAG